MATTVDVPIPEPLKVWGDEESRTYHYANGDKFTIQKPHSVWILANGSHRVKDGGGIIYRPTPGFLAISWLPKNADRPFIA